MNWKGKRHGGLGTVHGRWTSSDGDKTSHGKACTCTVVSLLLSHNTHPLEHIDFCASFRVSQALTLIRYFPKNVSCGESFWDARSSSRRRSGMDKPNTVSWLDATTGACCLEITIAGRRGIMVILVSRSNSLFRFSGLSRYVLCTKQSPTEKADSFKDIQMKILNKKLVLVLQADRR